MSKEKNVEAYVRSIEPGKRALVQTLRRLVADDHLDFGFFMGASLADPAGILVGNGKFLRMVKVRKAADIRPRELAGVIAGAVSLDGAGSAPKRNP
jgi:hypothetical protein